MPQWNDFGNIWSTLREVDVSAIRAEAEKPLAITCVGTPTATDIIDQLLHAGPDRYGDVGALTPIESVPLDQLADRAAALRSAALIIIAIDARAPLAPQSSAAFDQLSRSSVPVLAVQLYASTLPGGTALPRTLGGAPLVIPDPTVPEAADKFAAAVLDRLPSDMQLVAARRLPGLRVAYTRTLLNSTSVSNATYALTTSLPEQVPLLNVPFAIADIVILTKNQALMVYRMALAYGAPPDFQERVLEVLPVIGGGLIWRQIARTLISLIPIWGIVPKVAIAYGGTYATGVAAWGWFAHGERLSPAELSKLTSDAMAVGRARAKEITDRARQLQPRGSKPATPALPGPEDGSAASAAPARETLFDRVRRRLPGGGGAKR